MIEYINYKKSILKKIPLSMRLSYVIDIYRYARKKNLCAEVPAYLYKAGISDSLDKYKLIYNNVVLLDHVYILTLLIIIIMHTH